MERCCEMKNQGLNKWKNSICELDLCPLLEGSSFYLYVVINTVSFVHSHIRRTWQHFGIPDCLSCPHVGGADVSPCTDLILGKAEWTAEIDGGVPHQTDNTWFCLQGICTNTLLPCSSDASGGCSRGGEPFLHSMQIQRHVHRQSQDNRASVASSSLHLMIHVSATPGKKPRRHGGHLFNTGASCIANKLQHAWVRQRNTRGWMHTELSVNEILNEHTSCYGRRRPAALVSTCCFNGWVCNWVA